VDRVDALLQAYKRQVTMPWRPGLSGSERVWMAVYPPELERRVRGRIPEFEVATRAAGHGWLLHDFTTAFSKWMAAHPHREAYFKNPELLAPSLRQLTTSVQTAVRETLASEEAGAGSVVALLGVATLFPMVRVSDLLKEIAPALRGRLFVFFPGSYEDGNYRLLDARDGWNYLAIPITISEGSVK
jgi:hypothetical protein